MADQSQRQLQYQYAANSNLVLQADRGTRRDHEPTGEPETLYGKINPKSFGDRAQRTIEEEKQKRDKALKAREEKLRATGAERQKQRLERERY